MLLLIYITLINFFSHTHPFFVSITEIRQNDKSKNLEVSCRIFFDDLEQALEKKYHNKVNIIKPADQAKVNQLVADYLQKQVQLKANGKPVKLTYLGYEIEEDAAWCYLEASPKLDVKQLEVKNAILFEEHPEQQNMVHVTIKKQRKSTKLDNPNSRYTFEF